MSDVIRMAVDDKCQCIVHSEEIVRGDSQFPNAEDDHPT